MFDPFSGQFNLGKKKTIIINPGGGGGTSTSTGGSGITTITPGTTTITSGTDKRVLFDDNGVVGEDAGMVYDKTNDYLTVTGKFLGNGNGSATKPILADANYPTTGFGTYNAGDLLSVIITGVAKVGYSSAGQVMGSDAQVAWNANTGAFGGGTDVGLGWSATGVIKVTDGSTGRGDLEVKDEAYDATAWNGSLEVPTKNAIRDKIESMGGGGITIGTTTITSGTDTRILFDDGGVVGEDAGLTYNKTTDKLTALGMVQGSALRSYEGATGFTDLTHANASGLDSYPRSFFKMTGGASVSNYGMYVSGSAASNKEVFLGLSTQPSVTTGGVLQTLIIQTAAGDVHFNSLSGENNTTKRNWYFGSSSYESTTEAHLILASNGNVIINESGADADVRMEGDTDANLFFLDASTDRIGIGTASPTAFLHLKASTTASASLTIPVGTAPTSPNDGDMWREDNTNTGLKIRINGVTKTITVT